MGTCMLIWMNILLNEMGLVSSNLMVLHCDKTAAQHVQFCLSCGIKHIKVDCHIVHEKIVGKEIQIEHCSTEDQLSDFLTKAITEK